MSGENDIYKPLPAKHNFDFQNSIYHLHGAARATLATSAVARTTLTAPVLENDSSLMIIERQKKNR